jgi:hypothetical protein
MAQAVLKGGEATASFALVLALSGEWQCLERQRQKVPEDISGTDTLQRLRINSAAPRIGLR